VTAPEHVLRAVDEECAKLEITDPFLRALEMAGRQRRFTKADLRAQGAPPDFMRQVQERLRSGYLGVDADGLYVTDLGWTWIHGSPRRCV
jgi:hypothetical protein